MKGNLASKTRPERDGGDKKKKNAGWGGKPKGSAGRRMFVIHYPTKQGGRLVKPTKKRKIWRREGKTMKKNRARKLQKEKECGLPKVTVSSLNTLGEGPTREKRATDAAGETLILSPAHLGRGLDRPGRWPTKGGRNSGKKKKGNQ